MFCSVNAAGAADLYTNAPPSPDNPGPLTGFVSELRVGGLYHDPGLFSNRKEKNGGDVNAEILFASPNFLSPVWAPRPHLGTTINTAGETDQVYAGLTWRYNFWQSMFGEFSFGPSLHDGNLDRSDHSRKALGSPVLFRESLSLGWQFDTHNSISLMLDHISNGGLARYNQGLDTVGLRYGYHF